MVERYTMSEDESRLQHEIVITDPSALARVDSFNHQRLLEVIGNRPPAEAEAAYRRQREHTAWAA